MMPVSVFCFLLSDCKKRLRHWAKRFDSSNVDESSYNTVEENWRDSLFSKSNLSMFGFGQSE